jgi:hypothetical protein
MAWAVAYLAPLAHGTAMFSSFMPGVIAAVLFVHAAGVFAVSGANASATRPRAGLATGGKAAKVARKAAKGTAAYQVARRMPLVWRVRLVACAGVAAVAAVEALRGAHDRGAGA